MYYRYELEPKTQFLTAVIGKDGNSYFFYRNVRNLLDSRNIKDYCRSTLDDLAAPIIQVRDVLPQGNAVRFKYEHYFAIGEDTLQRIMDLYIQRIDRELYMWYLHMRVDKKVKLVQPEKFEKVLQVPYLSSNPAKMPRFVVCNSQDVDARFLLSDYLPLLINATLGYYREIERNRLMCIQQSEQQPDDAQSQPDALEEPPTSQDIKPFMQQTYGNPLESDHTYAIKQEPKVETLLMQEDCQNPIVFDSTGPIYSVRATPQVGTGQTSHALSYLQYVPDYIKVINIRNEQETVLYVRSTDRSMVDSTQDGTCHVKTEMED